MGKTRIPNLIAIVLLVVGLAAGVYLVQQRQNLRLSASPALAPKDLRITNITDTSFTVSWYTDENTFSFLNYGNRSQLGNVVYGEDREEKRLHYVVVKNLSPNTNYYFEVNSNGEAFNNSGIPWSVKTGPSLSSNTGTEIITGKVLTKLGTPASGVVVYVQIGGAQLVSAITSSGGNFLVPLNNIREQSLDNYINTNANQTLIDIFVQGGPLGISNAQLYASNINHLPSMTLGQTYDLRHTRNPDIELPEAKIELPDQQESSSFTVD